MVARKRKLQGWIPGISAHTYARSRYLFHLFGERQMFQYGRSIRLAMCVRNRMTIEETLYNPDFKPTEFGRFRETDERVIADLSGRKLLKGQE